MILLGMYMIPRVSKFHERNKFIAECRDNFMPYMAEDTALNMAWVVEECSRTSKEIYP
jgi:hypothetical protein